MLPELLLEENDSYLLKEEVRFHNSLCWPAIFAGVVTAIGVHLLMICLGAGIGLASFTPLTDESPSANFSAGAAVAWSLCALISLYVGGWVAGCFSAGPKTACLHGIVVWSVTMMMTFGLVASGGGLALGGAVKALGTGLGMTGKVAAAAASEVAGGPVPGEVRDQVASFIEEAVKAGPTNTTPTMAVRSRREIGLAVTKAFSPGNDTPSPENQAGLIKSLTENAGLSRGDAQKMVDAWMSSSKGLHAELDRVKEQAAQKAREAADRTASRLAGAATVAFFAFLLGLIITMLGGICGAKKTYRHTTFGLSST